MLPLSMCRELSFYPGAALRGHSPAPRHGGLRPRRPTTAFGYSQRAMPGYSTRLPGCRSLNRLARAQARLRLQGAAVIDLTDTNPTRCGFTYPRDLLAGLAHARGLDYEPAPLGAPAARKAVAAFLRRLALAADSERIWLTTGTSEAYGMLCRLLCDPGDEVAVPRPSYPLLDPITGLEAVRAVPYPLAYHGTWAIDLDALRAALTPRTRAVVAVSPNNPTGSFLTPADRQALQELCAAHDLALIVDEVFGGYPLCAAPHGPSVLAAPAEALTFALGGLSKTIGLPQLKLSWTVAAGPAVLVREALDRIALVADTYLSVSTPVQLALGELLERGSVVTAQIAARVRANYTRLQELARRHPATTLLPAEEGWSAVVQVPRTQSEEDLALRILEREHILVHPGYFYDFPGEAFLVLSLLPEEPRFAAAAARVLAAASG